MWIVGVSLLGGAAVLPVPWRQSRVGAAQTRSTTSAVRKAPLGEKFGANPGRKGETYYALEAGAVRVTSRFNDAVAVTERTFDGDLHTTLDRRISKRSRTAKIRSRRRHQRRRAVLTANGNGASGLQRPECAADAARERETGVLTVEGPGRRQSHVRMAGRPDAPRRAPPGAISSGRRSSCRPNGPTASRRRRSDERFATPM